MWIIIAAVGGAVLGAGAVFAWFWYELDKAWRNF